MSAHDTSVRVAPRPAPPAVPAQESRADSTISLAVRPAASLCGRSMVFTATVAATAPESGTPTGTVTISADDGPATPVALTDGVATLTIPLGAGLHTATASYRGDTWFNAAPPATLTTRIWRTGF